eukprot:evm.model.NODE_28910_length_23857_cov_28.065893.2
MTEGEKVVEEIDEKMDEDRQMKGSGIEDEEEEQQQQQQQQDPYVASSQQHNSSSTSTTSRPSSTSTTEEIGRHKAGYSFERLGVSCM